MLGGRGSRTGRDARLLLCAILIATVGQGMVLPFLFVYLTKVRHLDATVAGFVAAWLGLAGLLLAAPVGVLVDRVGSRRVFVALARAGSPVTPSCTLPGRHSPPPRWRPRVALR
jgi:predicted MFS family arabinose efflux permease